jgi:hypothetical protein
MYGGDQLLVLGWAFVGLEIGFPMDVDRWALGFFMLMLMRMRMMMIVVICHLA